MDFGNLSGEFGTAAVKCASQLCHAASAESGELDQDSPGQTARSDVIEQFFLIRSALRPLSEDGLHEVEPASCSLVRENRPRSRVGAEEIDGV